MSSIVTKVRGGRPFSASEISEIEATGDGEAESKGIDESDGVLGSVVEPGEYSPWNIRFSTGVFQQPGLTKAGCWLTPFITTSVSQLLQPASHLFGSPPHTGGSQNVVRDVLIPLWKAEQWSRIAATGRRAVLFQS